MKVTDKMFKEMIKIVESMIEVDHCFRNNISYKAALAKEWKIYFRLAKNYNWSFRRTLNFGVLVYILHGKVVETCSSYRDPLSDYDYEIDHEKLKDFFDHATVDMFEKYCF